MAGDPDRAAAGRGLVADEVVLPELSLPVRAEGAVGRAGDGVLRDAATGGEEAGDEVVRGPVSARAVTMTPRDGTWSRRP